MAPREAGGVVDHFLCLLLPDCLLPCLIIEFDSTDNDNRSQNVVTVMDALLLWDGATSVVKSKVLTFIVIQVCHKSICTLTVLLHMEVKRVTLLREQNKSYLLKISPTCS